VPLVVAATRSGVLAEAALAEALARRLQLPRFVPDGAFVEVDAVREVAYDLAEARCLLPIGLDRSGGRAVLRVAMADPLDAEAIEEIESSSGCQVEALVATPSEIGPAVQRYYRGVTTKLIHRPHGRAGGEDPSTQPHHRIEDEAPVEARHRALLGLLIEKGLISEEEYIEAIKRLLQGE
jgi:MshEN domain